MQKTQLQFRTSRGGLTLAADSYGATHNQPVLLMHGGGQTRHAWGSAARELADAGYHAIAIDLRGHGASDWANDGDYEFTTFAQDIVDIANNFPMQPIAVGASLGGIASLAAQHLAQHNLLRALVLVDVTPRLETDGLERIRDFMLKHAAGGFATLDEAADFVSSYTPQRRKSSNNEGLKKNLRLCEDGRYRWHWDPRFLDRRPIPAGETISATILEEAACALTIPALLVRGKISDVVSLDAVREFLTMVPHAQFVDIKDAGHMVAGDQNDVFSSAVLNFVRALP